MTMNAEMCRYCGGLIMEQGKTYGYTGKVCYCLVPGRATQVPLHTVPSYITEIINRLEAIEKRLEKLNV